MKRIYSILLAGVALFAVASCGNRGKKAEAVEYTDEVEAYDEEVSVVKIYSTAYDGYTNVRQSPTSKSKILGKLRNGNEYVTLVGMEGNWYEVEYYDQIGYVHKDHVGDTPSKPVTVDVDASWFNGFWSHPDSDQEGYNIYSNGKYTLHDYIEDYTVCHGRWRLEGNEIVFTVVYVTEYGRNLGIGRGNIVRMKINKSSRTLGIMQKWGMNSESDKEMFNYFKKEANKYVKNINNPILYNSEPQGTGSDQMNRVSSSSNNNESRTQKKGNSNDWDEVLTSYEKFVDQYISYAQRAANGHMDYVDKYHSVSKKLENLADKLENAEGNMSAAQLARYNKITKKLMQAEEEIFD